MTNLFAKFAASKSNQEKRSETQELHSEILGAEAGTTSSESNEFSLERSYLLGPSDQQTRVDLSFRSPVNYFHCPNIPNQCSEADLASVKEFVYDAGHNSSPKAARSELSPTRPQNSGGGGSSGNTERRYVIPDADPSATRDYGEILKDEATSRENISDWVHEGEQNMAKSMLSQIMTEDCLKTESGKIPSVQQSHWPGEDKFGRYAHPHWPALAENTIGGQARVLANYSNETMRPKSMDTQYAGGKTIKYSMVEYWGYYDNHRRAYINHLLGVPNPFLRRVLSQEEIDRGEQVPNAAHHQDLVPARVMSWHANADSRSWQGSRRDYCLTICSGPTAYLCPETCSQYNQRHPSYKGEESWTQMAIDNRESLMEGAYGDNLRFAELINEKMFAATQPAYRAADQFWSEQSSPPNKQGDPTKILFANDRTHTWYGMISSAIRSTHRLILEPYHMTGILREYMEAQIKEGKRVLNAAVTRPDGSTKHYEYRYSDVDVMSVKGAIEALMMDICQGRQNASGGTDSIRENSRSGRSRLFRKPRTSFRNNS